MVLEAFYSDVASHYSQNLPLVIYKAPHSKKIKALLQNNTEVYKVNDFTESGFVFAPFDDKNDTVLLPSKTSSSISAYVNLLNAPNISSSEVHFNSKQDQEQHLKNVALAIENIKEDRLKKVVLSRNEHVALTETNPIELFKRLITQYESAFVYCWFHPKIGLWLGATPETLLSISNATIKTMALAGTQKDDGSAKITWGEKEIEEQQLVTDYLLSGLEPLVEHVKVSEVKTVKAGNLLHLQTELEARIDLKSFQLKNILKALHPTPAVCGFPKDTAKQFILQHEHYNREYYTGFLGELNCIEKSTRNTNRRNVENNAYASVKKQTKLYVNLRCMQLKGKTAVLYVGGGITKDSNPELEWEETENKAMTMKQVLF